MDGESYRQMRKARERVRNLRLFYPSVPPPSMNRRLVVLGLYYFEVNFSRLDFSFGLVSLSPWTAAEMGLAVPCSFERWFDDENETCKGDCKPHGQAAP